MVCLCVLMSLLLLSNISTWLVADYRGIGYLYKIFVVVVVER